MTEELMTVVTVNYNTSDFIEIILDADAIFLKNKWDDILIDQLDDKTKIIGCPPVKIPIKPSDFPLVYATLFDTKIFKSLKLDMQPKNPEIGQDTGWVMSEKFLKNGYKCKVLEARSTRNYKEGPFRDIICAEYYLEGYDDVFACHFGRGATLGIAKYKEWNMLLRLPGINYITRRMQGYKGKREWLAICKEIVGNERKG